jgi:phospholipase C
VVLARSRSGSPAAGQLPQGGALPRRPSGLLRPTGRAALPVETISGIERLPTWRQTAIIVAYDDPGGWYDHVAPRIIRGSDDAQFDAYTADGQCGSGVPSVYPLRCGYAERLPLLAISPYARVNYVDHTLTDQSSILRFIEDNWSLGRIGNDSYDAQAGSIQSMFDFTRRRAKPLFLNVDTGEPLGKPRPGRG